MLFTVSSAHNISCLVPNRRQATVYCDTLDPLKEKTTRILHRRRCLLGLGMFTSSFLWAAIERDPVAKAVSKDKLDPKFVAAFNKALKDSSDVGKAETSWTEVIDLDSSNSYAWSNRGTIRLQRGEWQGAKNDLEKALELEQSKGEVSGLLFNNLGNAKGALGDWDAAINDFKEASLDEDITPIALANLALADFQIGKVEDSIHQARNLLRRDPNFLDMRAALTAFLWADGQEADAESEWNQLQTNNDGLGGMIYRREVAIKRVQGRWPPRAVAALDAFLNLARKGDSLDYDKTKKTYKFQ